MRNLYLNGALGQKFGNRHAVDAESIAETLKFLDCNFSDFKKYLVDCEGKNVSFNIKIEERALDCAAELILPITKGDIVITPIPAGSKSGGEKIIAGVLLGALVLSQPGFLMIEGGKTLGIAGTMLGGLSVNLLLAGIQQVMAPDPATDQDQEESYLFNGAEQNIIEGDPVPILYGRLRVPGQPINFEVVGVNSLATSRVFDPTGTTLGGDTIATGDIDNEPAKTVGPG
jgi:predicted phage tail protein